MKNNKLMDFFSALGRSLLMPVAALAACGIVFGITEPLEFSFMFVAPPLFLFHAVMGGLSFMLMSALGVAIGNTGGGCIDYLIWGVFQQGSGWYWVIVVGIPFAIIYYFVFKTYLSRKNITVDVTDEDDEEETGALSLDEKQTRQAISILEGLGGAGNISAVNNCLTRLRVDVKDMSKVKEDLLKKTGAMGFVHSSDTHIQVIYGPKVERIAANVREVLKNGVNSACTVKELAAFIDGKVIALEDVKDGVFSEKVLGDGFECKVKPGDAVKKGQPLLVFDRNKIKKAGYKDVSMLIITNSDDYPIKKASIGADVKAGTGSVIEF